MTNYDLYEILIYFLRKDKRGGVLKELEYERELQRMNIEYLHYLLPRYEIDQSITDKLDKFKTVTTGASLTISGGRITLPTDYERHGYLAYKQDGTNYRNIDILTDAQWASRVSSSISAPTERHPIAIYREGYIDFKPTTLTTNYLEYSYISTPTQPEVGGYYDANGNFVYLANGATKVLSTGEVGIDGTVSPNTYTSDTVELEWDDDDKYTIVDMILRRLGVVLEKPLVTQFNDQIIKEK